MSQLLVDFYMGQVLRALLLTALCLVGACAGGWWAGDRFDIPTVTVTP